MDRKAKRRLAVGGAVLATFGAAGGAYAIASNSDNPRDAYLNDVAGRLHVSRDQLNSALKGAFEDRLTAAVKAGKLTQQQADAIKQKVEQGGGPGMAGPGPGPGLGLGGKAFRGPGGPFGHGGPSFGARPVVAGFQAAAKYLGLTGAQLKQQLASGKSLAQIAGNQKKSVDGLKAAIRDSVKTKLDGLVNSKDLTQKQEDQILQKFDANIDNLINNTPPKLKGALKKHGFIKRPGGPPVPAGGPGGFFF